jgi:hypothetical protein
MTTSILRRCRNFLSRSHFCKMLFLNQELICSFTSGIKKAPWFEPWGFSAFSQVYLETRSFLGEAHLNRTVLLANALR